jgi:uncharacterized protein
VSLFGRLWKKIKLLWHLAKTERATPREIGWAVAIGVFAGCTPAIGFHMWIALALATLFRKNRLFAFIGSRVCTFFILPFIITAEVETAHLLRTGSFVSFDRTHAVEQAKDLLLDWCLGTIPVGGTLALVLGVFAYALARVRDGRKKKDVEKLPEKPEAKAA